jgi:hypothetical protein
MKKLALILAVVLVLSGVFAVAALTQVSMDREIKVSVASDIDPNVAVKFTVNTVYDDVAYLTSDNNIEFDLAGVLSGLSDHYNTEAVFVIGAQGAGNGVFTITNQTDITITINAVHGTGPAGVLQLLDSSGNAGEVVLSSGQMGEFHFRLNTAGAMTGSPNSPVAITAVLQIRQQ